MNHYYVAVTIRSGFYEYTEHFTVKTDDKEYTESNVYKLYDADVESGENDGLYWINDDAIICEIDIKPIDSAAFKTLSKYLSVN